jgi:hypothetical protein
MEGKDHYMGEYVSGRIEHKKCLHEDFLIMQAFVFLAL